MAQANFSPHPGKVMNFASEYVSERTIAATLAACVFALIAPCVGCSGAQTDADMPETSPQGDPDVAVEAARRNVEGSLPGPEQDEAKRKLDVATDRAVQVHVAQAQAAFEQRLLPIVEQEYAKAAKHRPEDQRVVSGKSKLAETRAKGNAALSAARVRLQRLGNRPVQAEERPEWEALLRDLEWLGMWQEQFPGAAELRKEATAAVVLYLLADARLQLALEERDLAEAQAQKALAWDAGNTEVIAFLSEVRGGAQAEALIKRADAAMADGRTETAISLFQDALKALPTSQAARQGLAEAKKRLVTRLLVDARAAQKALKWPQAMALAGQARAAGTEDQKLLVEVNGLRKEINLHAVELLWPKLLAAQAKKFDGAALIYAREVATMVADYKDVAKRLKALEASAADKAGYTVQLSATKVDKLGPEVAQAVLNAQFLALWQQGAWDRRKVILVDKKKKGPVDATLLLDWLLLRVARTQAEEARSKLYLDHVETVANPAHAEARGRQSSALTKLNSASDALRPVQEALNQTQANLHNSQTQLDDIEGKISSEDAQWYKDKVSPCPDGKLNCELTRAHKRWSANVEFYHKAIEAEKKKIAQLEPQFAKLQAEVDARQKAYDDAEKAYAETPQTIRRDVMRKHDYEVTRHKVSIEAQLHAVLREGHGKTQKESSQDAQVKEARDDFSTPKVDMKGTVLEAEKPNGLPEDPTLLADIGGKMLAAVLPLLFKGLETQGDRHFVQAGLAKTEPERVHWLMLAALVSDGLSPEVRLKVQAQLLELTGWRAVDNTIDYEKLPTAAK